MFHVSLQKHAADLEALQSAGNFVKAARLRISSIPLRPGHSRSVPGAHPTKTVRRMTVDHPSVLAPGKHQIGIEVDSPVCRAVGHQTVAAVVFAAPRADVPILYSRNHNYIARHDLFCQGRARWPNALKTPATPSWR